MTGSQKAETPLCELLSQISKQDNGGAPTIFETTVPWKRL